MGIIKWRNDGGNIPSYKGNGRMGRTTLLLIGTLPGYLLLQITSIHHHHSLLNHFYCIISKRSQKRYLWIVSPCPERVDWMWTPIRGRDNSDGRRWRQQIRQWRKETVRGDRSEYTQRGHRWCRIVPEVTQPCEYSFQGQKYVEHYTAPNLPTQSIGVCDKGVKLNSKMVSI
jgi:hypothetical protein